MEHLDNHWSLLLMDYIDSASVLSFCAALHYTPLNPFFFLEVVLTVPIWKKTHFF